jgi:hypothetical protein
VAPDFHNAPASFRRLAKFSKILTIISGAATLCFAISLFGFQVICWVNEDIWPDLSIAWAVTKLELRHSVFTTASEVLPPQDVTQFFWNGPTTALLFVITSLFGLFYLWLQNLEASLQGKSRES